MRALAAAALLALSARAAAAADIEQTARDAYGAYLQGRYEDSASGWRYLAGLGAVGPRPEANEALVQRDAGRPEAALPLWIKASLLDGAGGFVWGQRGWSALALRRAREAREDFQRAIDRSSTTAEQAEAGVGLGMAELLDGRPQAALEALRRAGVSGPYAIAVSAQLIAEAELALGHRPAALNALRQAFDADPDNREALQALMRLLDKIGDNRAAWLAARRAAGVDPGDALARRIIRRNAEYLTGDPDEASGVRRIARPVLDPAGAAATPAPSRTVRVGLYGGPGGRPATMTRCYLMMNAPFKVTAAAYGTRRDNGRAFDQWEIEYRAENGLVEVRDSARNLLFVSKQSFTFVPEPPKGSVLVKSARIADSVGVDVGDREVRGAVEVIPDPWGFRLVEQVPLEAYLYGVVSLALPYGSPPEAYKAQAVVSRSAALWAAGHRAPTLEEFDLLDDRSTQQTIGVSGELRAAADAVDATRGWVLTRAGAVARAPQHEDSGGLTEDGRQSGEAGLEELVSVSDSPRPLAAWKTPLDLERWVHEPPPQGLYSEAAAGPAPAAARWTRLLDADEIGERANVRRKIGRLRALNVVGRTASGRVKAVQAVGGDGAVTFTGFAEIQSLLSPGSLRSTLFTLQPLYRGRRLARVVVWGAGTGSGFGFSRAGAAGQAALGATWRTILGRYFPNDELRDLEHPAAAPPRPASAIHRRALNYRRAKKR